MVEEQRSEQRPEQRTGELRKIYKRETREFKEPKKDERTIKEPVNMVKGLIGKDITIYLRGGKELTGRLEAVAQYELVVTISQSPVIVMKHSVDYIIPVGEK